MKQYRIIYLSILLLSCYSRQVPRRGCNAKEPEDGDDDGEVVGVDDDEGEVGKLFGGIKKEGTGSKPTQQGNRKKNRKIN